MDRTGNLLGAAALLLSDTLLARAAEAAGRTGAAGSALAVLAQEPGLGIEQLRQPLGLTQSATVRVVDALVVDGLAVRERGADARSIAVRLTPDGIVQAQAVLDSRAAVLDDALAELSGPERDLLGSSLQKVLGRLTAGRAHAEQVCRLCDYQACPQQSCPVEQAACRYENQAPPPVPSPR